MRWCFDGQVGSGSAVALVSPPPKKTTPIPKWRLTVKSSRNETLELSRHRDSARVIWPRPSDFPLQFFGLLAAAGFFSKPSLKSRNTIFTLGQRGTILSPAELEGPILVPHTAQRGDSRVSDARDDFSQPQVLFVCPPPTPPIPPALGVSWKAADAIKKKKELPFF